MWLIAVAAVCLLAATVNWTETDWDYGDANVVRRHKAFRLAAGAHRRRLRHRPVGVVNTGEGVQNLNTDQPIGTFEPGPNARPLPGGGYLILPDPDAPPGEWSPFDETGQRRDAELEADGWHNVGAMTDDGVEQ